MRDRFALSPERCDVVAELNDNGGFSPTCAGHEPDAHGQAALLLVKSLIHVLIERSVTTARDALDTLATTVEVKEDVVFALGDSPASLDKSLALPEFFGRSLNLDLWLGDR